jgi:hypothetical protein
MKQPPPTNNLRKWVYGPNLLYKPQIVEVTLYYLVPNFLNYIIAGGSMIVVVHTGRQTLLYKKKNKKVYLLPSFQRMIPICTAIFFKE